MYTFGSIVGNIIQKSVKCIHSATKASPTLASATKHPGNPNRSYLHRKHDGFGDSGLRESGFRGLGLRESGFRGLGLRLQGLGV